MLTPSKQVIAIDYSYQGVRFGALTKSGVVTTFDHPRFELTNEHFAILAKRYQSNHFVLTGPGTEFLPASSNDFIFTRIGRIDALCQGIQVLADPIPTLVILFELGCHLFYHDKSSMYVGSLPYNFTSFGLENSLDIESEMGQKLTNALAICATHSLPQTRVLDRYEQLIAYTLALGIKEFLVRYNIKHIHLIGNISPGQQSLVLAFLSASDHTLDPSQNAESRIQNSPLPHSEHIAIFGMLNPYFQTNAGEN